MLNSRRVPHWTSLLGLWGFTECSPKEKEPLADGRGNFVVAEHYMQSLLIFALSLDVTPQQPEDAEFNT